MTNPAHPSIEFGVVDPESDLAAQAMESYFWELDQTFRTGFDVANAIAQGASAMRPPTGVFVMALDGAGRSLGCGGLQAFDDSTAELKRMWVAPPARGIGLGRAMVSELEGHARALGYSRVVLDTNASLTSAVNLYERCGYTAIPAYNDNPFADLWFEKRID